MQYSDDDVSVSGSEDELSGEEFEGFEGVSDEDAEADDPSAEPAAAAAAAAAAVAAAGGTSAGVKGTTRAMTDALISGEMSTQTALLQLELSELLSEVAAARHPGKQAAVQAVVSALKAALSSLPQSQLSAGAAAVAATTSAAAGALAGVVRHMGPDAQDVSLAVQPPAAVQAVGSWADGSAADLPGSTVDVAVQIPSSCLHHKDILNYRYHAKRALYLSQLSKHLAAQPAFSAAQQQLSTLEGDPYRPVLLLQLDAAALTHLLQQQQHLQKSGRSGGSTVAGAAAAAAFGRAGLVVRLLPAVGLDCFELSKLAPTRNNIRWVHAAAGAANSSSTKMQAQQNAGQELPPTPHYNAAILQDVLLLLSSYKQQQASHAAGPRFAEALVLFKVWAQQHSISACGVLPPAAYAYYGQPQQQQAAGSVSPLPPPPAPLAAAVGQADGFSGYLLSAVLTAAVQKVGAAAVAMSPLQLLKAALQLLADRQQWSKGSGLSLTRDSTVPGALRPSQQEQQQQVLSVVEGKVSKDHAKLVQKLQQQLQTLPAAADAPAAYKKAYGVIFLDSSGHLNLAASLSSTMLQMAQAAAQQSLALLNRQDMEPDAVYAAVFKPGQGLARVFHYCWTVELPSEPGSSSSSSGASQQQPPGDQHAVRLAESEVEGLVRAALGSRARLVKAIRRAPLLLPAAGNTSPQHHSDQQQPADQQKHRKKAKHSHKQQQAAAVPADTNKGGSSSNSSGRGGICVPRRILVGAVVDPVAVLRLVDVGPAADDAAAAAKFRKLWGDESELRRFQDGKICEAVVWEGIPTGMRHKVPDLAVAHVLQRHLPPGTVITSCATALDPLLYASSSGGDAAAADNVQWGDTTAAVAAAAGSDGSSSVAVSIGGSSGSSSAAAEETAASRAADAALDSLAKQLRGLSDLALKVIGVQPLSSISRHTCCFYPEPHPLAEGSGARAYTSGVRVPRVLEPIDVMVQLESTGKMPLNPEAFAKTKAALGVQLASTLASASGAHVTATEEALEVLWQGFAFKLNLYLDREGNLPGLAGSMSGSNSSGQQALPVLLSSHHGLVLELAAAHAAYGPTVRLVKRWLGAHLLLGAQVCEEAVELLVGAVFQGPSTAPPPAFRITGFLGFLHLLCSHPWSADPLLVDPAGVIKQEGRRALQAEFDALRESGAAPAIFLATPYDMHTSRWTRQQPSSLVIAHLVSLARSTWHAMSQLLLLGADAPTAQQQLAALLQEQQQSDVTAQAATSSGSKNRGKQLKGVLGDAADSLGSQLSREQLCRMEACAVGRAWRVLCSPVLGGFDGLILLRKEALPFADRADPLAVQQLQALVAQQHRQQRRLAAAQKQQHGGLQVLLGGGGGSVQCAAPKNARALLRSIPEQVLLSKPADKLRSELLVGFDPLEHYLSVLTQRYGHMAQFCADSSSGFPAVGIKWQPSAFLPGPLRPNMAHAQMEVCATASAAAGVSKSAGKGKTGSIFSSRGLLVPNLSQVLCETAEMGLGLVEEVLLL